jgi:rRNA maturation protein Rpf1
MTDVESIRAQLKTPQWSRIVGSKSNKGETSEIYVKKNGNEFAGLVVINAEPRELTVVHIDGPIDPSQLSELSGHMGIPELGKSKSKKSHEED